MDYKPAILENLILLRKQRQAEKDIWKVKAYTTAIKSLQEHQKPITNEADLKDIQGLGKSIHGKIVELMQTGAMQAVVEAKKHTNVIDAIDLLTTVSGIGPVKAKELVEEHGIRTIDQLRERPELLNDKQAIGLKYYDDIAERIPRNEIDKHRNYITPFMDKCGVEFEIAGSYRRGAKDSGDIDILLTSSDGCLSASNEVDGKVILNQIVDALTQDGYLYETLAKGDKKYMGLCRLKRFKRYRRIDIMYCTPDQYPFAVLYFTGSGDFNVEMRNYALSKGYSLSEYGLKSMTTKRFVEAEFRKEEDIFRFLGIQYIPPNERKAGVLEKHVIID
jgi:DNA polymerase beta